MTTLEDMAEILLSSSMTDIVMKCGQIVCGRVHDLDGEYILVRGIEGETIMLQHDDVAFFRIPPPQEPVRYPNETAAEATSPYCSPIMMDSTAPAPSPAGRMAENVRSRLERVKARHRQAEFVDRSSKQNPLPFMGPRLDRSGR